ncbi:heparinase [Vibrio cyclitrophicus]|uniref:heparinase II/III family protein n=1 Tax=Vibrio cyclitrophicus TaxID=47951 RepID=UPI000C8348C7|nr:heparinase II/III family protein [Vibrio cyclitrophicus]PME15307.1 heparinase [Vibrio cyclitrophicus]
MQDLKYLYHTVKHLKATQLINRFNRKLIKSKLIDCPGVVIRKIHNSWLPVELIKSSYIQDRVYCFLNHQAKVSNWNDSAQEKLWLYNLHYFDDLNAIGCITRQSMHRELITRWIGENPPLIGNGWEPYPQSLRIVNWIQWFLSGNFPEPNWQRSLWQQAAVLEQDIEYHLLGNHLFANAKALVFAGCYFSDGYASRWLNKGLSIIDKELIEQILGDGGNFELTPMYHNIILSDMLDLVNLTITYQHPKLLSRVDNWKNIIVHMLRWMNIMTHPDGDVPFFNDSAIGIAPTAEKLNEYAGKLGFKNLNNPTQSIIHLKDSGYIKLSVAQVTAFLDVAKVGPNYIPGHAHADTLSFELSIDGYRVFVNSGTSVYGLGEERLRQRKTEAHNTVVVDGMDSSEVWSGFRVARRAYPSDPVITASDGDISVECYHDGYMRLPGKVTHTRKWKLTEGDLCISDNLTGTYNHAEAHYHLHPGVRVEVGNHSSQVILHLPNATKYTINAEGADIKVLETTWHPEFGLSIANKKLVLNFKQNEVNFVLKRA